MIKNKAAYEKNAKSFLALRDLLQLIIRQPAPFAENEMLLKALKSQGAMASLELSFEDHGATKLKERMSTNTLKAHAANAIEQGFEGFDALRIAALDKLLEFRERTESSNKRTKAGLSKRTSELEEQLEVLRQVNMVLLQGLSFAITEFRTVKATVKPDLLEDRAQNAADSLLGLLTLNPPPFNMPVGNANEPDASKCGDTPGVAPKPGADTNRKVTDLDDYRK